MDGQIQSWDLNEAPKKIVLRPSSMKISCLHSISESEVVLGYDNGDLWIVSLLCQANKEESQEILLKTTLIANESLTWIGSTVLDPSSLVIAAVNEARSTIALLGVTQIIEKVFEIESLQIVENFGPMLPQAEPILFYGNEMLTGTQTGKLEMFQLRRISKSLCLKAKAKVDMAVEGQDAGRRGCWSLKAMTASHDNGSCKATVATLATQAARRNVVTLRSWQFLTLLHEMHVEWDVISLGLAFESHRLHGSKLYLVTLQSPDFQDSALTIYDLKSWDNLEVEKKKEIKLGDKVQDITIAKWQNESLIQCHSKGDDSNSKFSLVCLKGVEVKKYGGNTRLLCLGQDWGGVLQVTDNSALSITGFLDCQPGGLSFLGHSDAVRLVHCVDDDDSCGHLITCADDKTTRLWTISNMRQKPCNRQGYYEDSGHNTIYPGNNSRIIGGMHYNTLMFCL